MLLAGGALGLGWLAVQAAAVETYGRRAPEAAARFSPDDPRVAIGTAMRQFRQKGGAIEPEAARRATDALADAPLAEEPFLIAGLAALVAQRPAQAAPLLEEARRRNPRSRFARLLLLDRYLRTGEVKPAVAEIAAIGRLIPEASRVLVPELAKFATRQDSAAATAQMLRGDAEMRGAVLYHLATQKAPADEVMRLASDTGRIVPGQPEQWQGRLLENVVAAGDLATARTLWSRFAGVDEAAIRGGIYDPRFQRLPGPAPFNWSFSSSGAGVAEPTRAPALQIEYYGRADAELASQLVTLAPGRYRLSYRAAGSTPGQASSVSWRVSCHPGAAEVASLPIAKLSYTPAVRNGTFTVPASGCSSQWLRLIGTPSEFPAVDSITLSDLGIAKVGPA